MSQWYFVAILVKDYLAMQGLVEHEVLRSLEGTIHWVKLLTLDCP